MTTYHRPYFHTCRFCGKSMRFYEGVKYGVRHYAHFACYLDSDRPLAALHKRLAAEGVRVYAVQITLDGETKVLLHTIRGDRHNAEVQLRNFEYYRDQRPARHWSRRATDLRVVPVTVTVTDDLSLSDLDRLQAAFP